MEMTICPICGRTIRRESEAYDLQDARICVRCADDLRFLYPYDYLLRSTKLKELPQCQDMARKDITYIRKRLQKLPMRDGNTSINVYRMDRMCVLTLKEFKDQLVSADAEENRVRRNYLDYTNILTVDYTRPLSRTVGKKGVQNVRKRKHGYCVSGYIKAGTFREGDLVGILHRGALRWATVLVLYQEDRTVTQDGLDLRTSGAENIGDLGEQGRCLRAGYQVTMILSDKAGPMEAGDWIVSD